MASKASREGESPSASINLLPQIRTRRGSLASLASITQPDKEAIAQALDQIHISASQSESLTTFNEYTSPPSSSSGPDTKGIAADLQGGISGLYNRLRASVGNVRDAVGTGPDDRGSERAPIENLRASTPASIGSLKGAEESHRDSDVGTTQDDLNKQRSAIRQLANDSRPSLDRVPTLKPPPTPLKQPTRLAAHSFSPAQIHGHDVDESHPSKPNEAGSPNIVQVSPEMGRTISEGKEALASPESNEKKPLHQGENSVPRAPPVLHVDSSTKATGNHASLRATPDTKNSHSDDVFGLTPGETGSLAGSENHGGSRYQHLEIPLRKSLAPPILNRSASPRPSLSRASSTDTNADSLMSVTQHSSSPPTLAKLDHESRKNGLRGNLQTYPKSAVLRDPRTMNVFSQVKNKVLNKEYWMKDENARDCFFCGDAFSTFRRKHHCRTCGQIFDAKCTSVISGEHFGQTGTLRVCKPCEGIIRGDDDSSEFSDDGSCSLPGFRPRHGSTGAGDTLASPFPASSPVVTEASYRSNGNPDFGVPTMSIPATRKAGEKAGRKPTVLDFGSERGLSRPSSSRSLKSAFGSRSHGPGHRRHNSRNQFPRMFKPVNEDNAPFHQDVAEKGPPTRLATFHDDNIIDPDLAPYLSDEQSSGDEQMSIMAALNGGEVAGSFEEKHGWEAGYAPTRKGRSRLGDKSLSSVTFAGRETDAYSLSGVRPANLTRSSKRRNFSISSATHLRPSPKSYRTNTAALGSNSNLRESASAAALNQMASSPSPSGGGGRMIRSSSMRGSAAPAIELNNASLQHVRKLLSQLLTDNGISSTLSWEKALLPILLRATDDVNPDVQNGDDIDIRHYVKLKKIPGGRPGDTTYVSGLVFTKNLALKCMPRSIAHPNILILTFPLEYARHHQHFMSLEPVIRQEREFLQNLVNRIAALRPQLLLVERHVSGLALEFLEQANIATAYNVKTSVLEAVSRCCQTRIISSIDKLAIKPAQAGKCASFYLKTYLNNGRRKTYMFLSGCAKELGCTIALRGADMPMLRKIKRITEFMIYVVYNLKLETCLMKDEFASIPSDIDLGSLSPGFHATFQCTEQTHLDTRNDQQSQRPSYGYQAATSSSNITGLREPNTAQGSGKHDSKASLHEVDSMPDDVPMPTFYEDMVEEHRTKILSASPFVKFMQPYLLMRAREQERRLAYLKRLRDQDIFETQAVDDQQKTERFDLIRPEMVHKRVPNAPKKVREVLSAVHDAEYDKALHTYQTQSKQWEAYIAGNINLFDPYAHQNIAVLYSVVCTVTTVPCSGPDMVALGFYNEHETNADFEADCTLGQYVEDLCLGANTICTSNGCEKKMIEHHRQYVHGEAQLSVFVERYPCKMRGLQDTILMWSACRKCELETQVMHMSENTWKYSFGKYLELSFWSSELQAQENSCPHDLHRDHLRYFGFKDVAVRIHYDPINLLEIIVPRARVTWKVDNDLRFKNEVFNRIEERSDKFMISVKSRIKGISADSVLPEKTESCKKEIERLGKLAAEDHYDLTHQLRESYMDSKHYEIVPLNQAIRALQEKVIAWDNAFSDFDKNYFPSEKDIRRLATLQLKKIFLDRDDSSTSLASDGSASTPEVSEEKPVDGEVAALAPQTRRMSPDKAHDMLASVVENDSSTHNQSDENQSAALPAISPLPAEPSRAAQEILEGQNMRHLDLAVTSEMMERSETTETVRPSIQDSNAPVTISTPANDEEDIRKDPSPSPTSTKSTIGDQKLPKFQPTPSAKPAIKIAQSSGIPRPTDVGHGTGVKSHAAPSLSRAYSQPAINRNGEPLVVAPKTLPSDVSSLGNKSAEKIDETSSPPVTQAGKPADRKISDRLGLSALKPSGISAHSMIPRSIASRRKDSRVSHLAKHFEQLSREFEKERLKERRQRAAQNRHSQHPMRASRPIVQVYRNVHEAVEEKDPSDEDLLSSDPSNVELEKHPSTSIAMAQNQPSETAGEGFHVEETTAENTEAEETTIDDSRAASDVEGEGIRSDDEQFLMDDIKSSSTSDEHHALSTEESQLDLKLDLPKHEKTSLMKMLTNFWAERSASGWQPLDYPLRATEHIFADSDIIVREDEPSSLIAFALGSEDYQAKLGNIMEKSPPSAENIDKNKSQDSLLSPVDQVHTEESLLRPTGTHLKYQFSEGSAKMLCKVFYAEQFDAVRRKCGVSTRMVESLSRCLKWDSKGGKTKSVFLKTLDDRFVLKSLSPIETQAFLRFAPAYFRIMSESLFHELPSVIAKMLGFYQVIIKNPATGVEFNWFLLVMENLFYDRSPTRIFDLKGSMRNRRIQSTGEQNEVLLDENMVEFIYESPLFAREHSTKLLRASVWNDTLFLSRQNVMDYSLMIAIDENRKELVVGIIDCIRTYTWDKKLESWIKDRGKNRPTVTSPKEYKSRFREAMGRYVLQAPNCWHQFKAQHVENRPLRQGDVGDDKEAQVMGL